MTYCVTCGAEISEDKHRCGACGMRRWEAPSPPARHAKPTRAGALCVVAFTVSAVAVLHGIAFPVSVHGHYSSTWGLFFGLGFMLPLAGLVLAIAGLRGLAGSGVESGRGLGIVAIVASVVMLLMHLQSMLLVSRVTYYSW